jgi:hypothetical protein
MAQAVSCWPLTAEARVRARVDPCGICGGQSGTVAGFSLSSSVFPCQFIPPLLHICYCPMRCAIAPTKQYIITTSVLNYGLHF